MADAATIPGDGTSAVADPPARSKKDRDSILKEAIRRRAYARDVDNDNREEADKDNSFVWEPGAQWEEGVRRAREADGQPCLEINQLPQFVHQVSNSQRQDMPSIKVRSESDEGEDTADIVQGMTRHIEADSAAPTAYIGGLEGAVVGGRGYWRVVSEYISSDSFDQKLVVKAIGDHNSVILDPDYQQPDASDTDWGFIDSFMSKEDFELQHPDADAIDWNPDDVKLQTWFEGNDRILVCEYFRRVKKPRTLCLYADGSRGWKDQEPKPEPGMPPRKCIRERQAEDITVEWYKLAGGQQVLKEYVWAGKYVPIIMCIGKVVWIKGKRVYMGLVRAAKDTMRMYNYSQSALAEEIALSPKAPFIAAEGQTEDNPQWATANRLPHAVLTYKPVLIEGTGTPAPAPQRQMSMPVNQALVELAQTSQQNLRAVMGLYDPSMGANENDQSGRAILALQKQGDVSTFHFRSNFSRAIELTGKIIVDAMPHYYDTDRMATVIGEDDEVKNVRINKYDAYHQAIVENNVTEGKFAVSVDSGPSYQTKRMESVASMMEFVKAFPMAGQILADIIAKNMDWPGNDEMVDRLRAMLPPPIQQMLQQKEQGKPLPPEAQQAVMGLQTQLQQMGQQMQEMQQALQEKQSESNALVQKASIETQAKYDQILIQSATAILTTAVELAMQSGGGSVDGATGVPLIQPVTPADITGLANAMNQMVQTMRGPDPQTAQFAEIGGMIQQMLHQAQAPRVLQVHSGPDGLPSGGTSTPMPVQGMAGPGPHDPEQIKALAHQVFAAMAKPKHVIPHADPQTGEIHGGIAITH